jgi:tRNA1Val (adenine37-N6)-methyltransferase
MANQYFEFKQFKIEQSNSAMKVSTDACIFGALLPPSNNQLNILDIGSGTGLLSLMFAQKNPKASIVSIEIDKGAYSDANKNFSNSKFAHQIQLFCENINTWQTNIMFDLIICNPPFFTNNLKNQDVSRTIARHNDSLTQKDLAKNINRFLNTEGITYILLPTSESANWETVLGKNNLFIYSKTFIIPNPQKAANRIVYAIGKIRPKEIQFDSFYIYDNNNQYTVEMKELLYPYYL